MYIIHIPSLGSDLLLDLKDVVFGLAGELDNISISDVSCIEGNYHLLYLNAKKFLDKDHSLESFRKYLSDHISKTSNSKRNEVIAINIASKHLMKFLDDYSNLKDFIEDLKKLLISIEEGRMRFHEELTNNHDLKMMDFIGTLF
jgi:hypothetical protein